jgi:hypothetical protein
MTACQTLTKSLSATSLATSYPTTLFSLPPPTSCLVCSVEVSLQLIRPFVCAVVALTFSSVAPAFAADNSSPDYGVTKSIVLGSGERWDYITFDPTGTRRAGRAHADLVMKLRKSGLARRRRFAFGGKTDIG